MDLNRNARGNSERSRDAGRGNKDGYEYKNRSADAMKKRGESGGGDFDRFLRDDVKMFKPADGDNIIRPLPPTWDGAEHFGLDIFIHYNVGPDNQAYLCLEKMQGKPCPICDERAKATKDGDQEFADKLKPSKRVLVWLIDRNNEKEGPMVWSMPWTIDRDICKLVVDKRTGEVLPIDHPEEGYDLEFERKGKMERTQYIGLAIARRSSDLGNKKWLEEIVSNPLPELLQYYEYDHIMSIFGGGSIKGGKSSHSSADDLDTKQDKDLKEVEGKGRNSRNKDSEELTWEGIHEMTYDEMCSIIDSKELKIDPDDSKDDDDLADWICDYLKLKKSSSRKSVSTDDDSDASKLRKMREERGR